MQQSNEIQAKKIGFVLICISSIKVCSTIIHNKEKNEKEMHDNEINDSDGFLKKIYSNDIFRFLTKTDSRMYINRNIYLI